MGIARGKRTLRQTCRRVMPSPAAVSSIPCGTPSRPATVFSRMGGTANNTSAAVAGMNPVPMTGISRKSTARLGTMRSVWNTASSAFFRPPYRTHKYPPGTAMSSATARDAALISTCSRTADQKAALLAMKYAIIA